MGDEIGHYKSWESEWTPLHPKQEQYTDWKPVSDAGNPHPYSEEYLIRYPSELDNPQYMRYAYGEYEKDITITYFLKVVYPEHLEQCLNASK
jgi:hypothetical protein